MLPSNIKPAILQLLTKHFGQSVEIKKVEELGGGCINTAFAIHTNAGGFFVKLNSASLYPGMFETEACGLKLLAKANQIEVPVVIGFGQIDTFSYLVLELVEKGVPSIGFWENFGRGLARLHKTSSINFGLDHDNYIGSLAQANKTAENWIDFFVSQRLLPQISLAKQKDLLSQKTNRQFQSLFRHLADFFPPKPPSLLHGDLWGGNFMTGGNGQAVIIDPAVYFGHRYMDIAMTKLFGGFSSKFYDFYQEEFPMEKGWQKGLEIANLYPLMVHLNLFGESYLGSINQILQEFD